MEEKRRAELPHHLILEGRYRLTVSGVEDVESFDENAAVIFTSKGLLIVRGSELHVDKLSIEGGEFYLEGQIDSLQYEEERKQSGGFWSRMFK
jgi:sporulation protein YabP